MGWKQVAVRNVAAPKTFASMVVGSWMNGSAQLPEDSYEVFAREGYKKNELVFAAIEELSTSNAEPRFRAKRGGQWKTSGEPILDLLARPNPFMDAFEFEATRIMHTAIAGNGYGRMVRSRSDKVVEIWLMRPDRVRIVPSSTTFIKHYEYHGDDGAVYEVPVRDVIHWKWGGKSDPLNPWYGMSPLKPISGRIDIDNYMRDFVKAFFVNAGVPGGMLATKSPLTPEFRQEIKERFKNDYGGRTGWHDLLVLDGTEATFTSMTQNMGPSGLVVPELDNINEARILMAFQVPPELIGARVGMMNSSYAQKKAARESFWDETLAPMFKASDGPLNLRLVPNFAGITEVEHDLSDVRALQGDIDLIDTRERASLMAGGQTLEEYRKRTGRPEQVPDGTMLIPSNMVPVKVQGGVIMMPENAAAAAVGATGGGDGTAASGG